MAHTRHTGVLVELYVHCYRKGVRYWSEEEKAPVAQVF
jgi:hypothetical protein